MSYETAEDMEQHPLYDTAMEEVVSLALLPGALDPMPLEFARILMIACWLRGAGWANEHREAV